MTSLFRQARPLMLGAGLFCAMGSAKVLFKADFETGDLSEWSQTGTRSQNASSRNVQVVSDIVQQGKYAGKFTIHEDDVFNAGQLRVQVGGPKVTVEEGSDTYMSFYMYMAEPPKDRDNFFYWEGTPPPRYNNVMTWWVEPQGAAGATIKYGTGNLGRNGTHWEADFAIGQWHQVAMHIHWSEDAERGNTRLWFDGKLVLDKKPLDLGINTIIAAFDGPGSNDATGLLVTSANRPLTNLVNVALADFGLFSSGASFATSYVGASTAITGATFNAMVNFTYEVQDNVVQSGVPEPSTLALVGGVLVLAGIRKFKS